MAVNIQASSRCCGCKELWVRIISYPSVKYSVSDAKRDNKEK